MEEAVVLNSTGGDRVYFRRLRDMREDHDLKQVDIADYLGIQQTVYSRYERGTLTIPVEHLLILADFYNVSTYYILGRTNVKAVNRGEKS